MFLDEINTCDHLGLITELICHRSMLGVALPHNLSLIAACNPYRLRKKQSQTSGLEGKIKWDELSKLVYRYTFYIFVLYISNYVHRVHPLPEALMDYVWDYGTLDSQDEKSYISNIMGSTVNKMTDDLLYLLVESVFFSQNCIKPINFSIINIAFDLKSY